MSLYFSCHVSLLLLFVVYFITRTTLNEIQLNSLWIHRIYSDRFDCRLFLYKLIFRFHNNNIANNLVWKVIARFHEKKRSEKKTQLIHKQIVSTQNSLYKMKNICESRFDRRIWVSPSFLLIFFWHINFFFDILCVTKQSWECN
jgi:hypothetical protein